jgi:uncharacterized small protein (DUF1192 family)
MSTYTEQELKDQIANCNDEIEQLRKGIRNKLAGSDFNVDNMCALVNELERKLARLKAQLCTCEPGQENAEAEQQRKAAAIIAGGRGVEIRAKNDDAGKYVQKKRKTYDDIIKDKAKPQANGHGTPSALQQAQSIN